MSDLQQILIIGVLTLLALAWAHRASLKRQRS
jgi:hypothetical protein